MQQPEIDVVRIKQCHIAAEGHLKCGGGQEWRSEGRDPRGVYSAVLHANVLFNWSRTVDMEDIEAAKLQFWIM